MGTSALLESSPANGFPFVGGPKPEMKPKRKTPSELRGEQLKRTINEHYPVKKFGGNFRVPHGKEKAKEPLGTSERSNEFIKPSLACGLPEKIKSSFSRERDAKPDNAECSNPFAKSISDQGARKAEQNNQHNVAECHLGKKITYSAKIDMEKALKGFIPQRIHAISTSSANSFGKLVDLSSISSSNLYSRHSIPGCKPPLDFALKSSLQLISSNSVKWCHKLSASSATIDYNQLKLWSCSNKDPKNCSETGHNATTEVLFSKALHSWAYPQSSLPPSVISLLALASAKGEADFLVKRQKDWEDSFRNLYYLGPKEPVQHLLWYLITTLYTKQFVALFIGANFSGKKRTCNAYISQSTRGLRSLLKKHDICFSMPFCHAEAEQTADDDLVELSEIEKQNLGQAFHLDSMADVDNTPRSLLAFIGNENVHCLYDILLNYRFFFNSLTDVDVPALYAPVPFQNSSLCIPEVRCKEMKRADVVPTYSGSDANGAKGQSTAVFCYSIEITDTVLPPWIVCGVSAAMSSIEKSFELSFTTIPESIGLNIALDTVRKKSNPVHELNKSFLENGDAFGIPEATVTPCLSSASLRRLTYSNESYVAHVAPI